MIKNAVTIEAVHTHTHTLIPYLQREEVRLTKNRISFGAKGGNNIELPRDIK